MAAPRTARRAICRRVICFAVCERRAQYVGDAELVNLVSEYLFDLFDANMMDEYKALENFELDCTQYFDPDADE